MTLNEYKQGIEKDFHKIDTIWIESTLYSFYQFIDEKYSMFNTLFQSSSTNVNSISKAMNDFVKEIQDHSIKTDIGNLYIVIKNIKENIENNVFISQSILEKKESIVETLDILWNQVNNLFRDPSNFTKIVGCYNTLKKLDNLLMQTKYYLDTVIKIENYLSQIEDVNDNEMEYTLQLFNIKLDIKDFAQRMTNLVSIYEKTCYMLNINYNDFPMKTIKIEYGSLFCKFVGNESVIKFIDWFIKIATKKHTVEGKLETLSQQVDILDQQVSLFAKLKELLDPEEFKIIMEQNKEHLINTTAIISKNTSKLIMGVTKIQSNDKVLNIESDIDKKYIEDANTLLIEDETDTKNI